jgi:hypothetical protein
VLDEDEDGGEERALIEGYRGAFWFCFASIGVTLFATAWGL